MTLQATTALLYRDADLAASGLRNELSLIAMDEKLRPDWSTFRLSEANEVVGLHGRIWYEWTGTVDALTSEDVGRVSRSRSGTPSCCSSC